MNSTVGVATLPLELLQERVSVAVVAKSREELTYERDLSGFLLPNTHKRNPPTFCFGK